MASLTVIVPALNESEHIPQCLDSLRRQLSDMRIFVSDNASDDETSEVAKQAGSDLRLSARRLAERCEATEHFVSAARWALESSDTTHFGFLAADDEWLPGFAEAVATRFSETDAEIVLPSFVWRTDEHDRLIRPSDFLQRHGRTRQLLALALPDWKELANLVYAVYSRDSFCSLVDALERGENHFAADYAAAWRVLGSYRAAGCEVAVGIRRVRADADLLQRVGMQTMKGATLQANAAAYVRLYFRVNRGIARALRRAKGADHLLDGLVLAVRLPQALLGIARQLNVSRARRRMR